MNTSIHDTGAQGDGLGDQARAIQAAVEACADSGGGTVTVPPGHYRSGSVGLRSGVRLHLDHGATLEASDDPAAFPPLGRHDGKLTDNHGFGALIQARGTTDLAITGPGRLVGRGDPDRPAPPWKEVQGIFRPALIYFEDCSRYRIQDLGLEGATWWTVHLLRCVDGIIRGVRIRNTWPNSDGIDPDGCRNLVISDCLIEAGDDCIVAKSTRGDACENLAIANCVLRTSCACLKLGTETRGAFRNVTMANCTLAGAIGFALYMKDGGSFENVQGSHLTLDCTHAWPVVVDAMPRDYRSGLPAGRIRNVLLSHLQVRGPGRIWIEGTAEQPVENLSLTDVQWEATGPLDLATPKPLGSARVVVDPDRPAWHQAPAHMVASHVRGLYLDRIRVSHPPGDRYGVFGHALAGADIRLDAGDWRGPQCGPETLASEGYDGRES